MNRILRVGLLLALVVLAALAVWRIVGIMRSDAALDRGDHADALRWRPDNPEALLRHATARHAASDLAGTEALARTLLASSPADGRGYRLLAQVAEARGDREGAATLYAIAVRRAPRDLQARAWLAQEALAAGNYKAALDHVDRVLRMSTWATHERLFPVLTQLAADPAFADALAEVLGTHPPWRDGILAALHAADKVGPRAADQVLAALQRRNDLDARSTEAWIEALIRQGRWGEAFARWAGPYVQTGRALPLLFNGDFASAPEGGGFDWRVPSVAGVMVSVEPLDRGGMLRLRFLGRRVPGGWWRPMPSSSHPEHTGCSGGNAWTACAPSKALPGALAAPGKPNRSPWQNPGPGAGLGGRWRWISPYLQMIVVDNGCNWPASVTQMRLSSSVAISGSVT